MVVCFTSSYEKCAFMTTEQMSQPKIKICVPKLRIADRKLPATEIVSNETDGLLVLGAILLDIRNGLEILTRRKNRVVTRSRTNYDEHVFKYTVMLYINRDSYNVGVQFLEIFSDLPKSKIIEIFFNNLKCELPYGKQLNREKNNKLKHFGEHDGFYLLEIWKEHAYIYIGDSDGEHYHNNIVDAVNFIYRDKPLAYDKPNLCSMM